jgi:hypothetical protein
VEERVACPLPVFARWVVEIVSQTNFAGHKFQLHTATRRNKRQSGKKHSSAWLPPMKNRSTDEQTAFSVN